MLTDLIVFTEQAEVLKKLHEAEKDKLRKFRVQIESVINKFVADETKSRHKLPPMDHTQRTVAQDVIDVAGLTCHTFGMEDVDRHIIVFKAESLPCEDELAALRRGEVYDPEQVKQRKLEEEAEEQSNRTSRKRGVEPASNYKEKYEHLIGKDAGKSAAQATVTNKQFGYVPSANKKDQRSIEQTLADIQKKKKQKTDDAQDQD